MLDMRHLTLCFIAAAVTLCSEATAAPDKVAYELQEKCGRESTLQFERYWGKPGQRKTDSSGTTWSDFNNHYNATRNACYMLVTSTTVSLPPNAKRKKKSIEETVASFHSSVLMSILDVNENREAASYWQTDDDPSTVICKVDGHVCRSRAEWESLTAPLMRD